MCTALPALIVAAVIGMPALTLSWYVYLAIVVFGVGLIAAICLCRKRAPLPP
jgi:hypothetical protein